MSANDGVEKAFVEAFEAEVLHLAQQEETRLKGKTRERTGAGKTYNFERLASTDTVEKTTRHTPTPVQDMPHSRRKVDMKHWFWGTLVDEQDEIQVLIEPRNEYARNCAMAMNRRWDDLLIAAALADVTDGDGNTINFATDGGVTIPEATSGMTIDKVLATKEAMDAAEVPNEDRCLVLGSRQVRDLLSTTEVTSSDYSNVKALMNGEVNTLVGFDIIRSERLALATTTRSCFAFQKDGLALWTGLDMKTRIEQRRDLSYAWQVFARFSAVATRLEGARVVEVLCSEA
jgi:hypothetical protein